MTSYYISLPHIKLNNSNIESLSRYVYIRNLTAKHTTDGTPIWSAMKANKWLINCLPSVPPHCMVVTLTRDPGAIRVVKVTSLTATQWVVFTHAAQCIFMLAYVHHIYNRVVTVDLAFQLEVNYYKTKKMNKQFGH